MSNTKHTPGPWWTAKIREGRIESEVSITVVCDVGDITVIANGSLDNSDESDARLITAAPDMFATLKEISKLIDSTYGVEGHVAGVASSWEKTGIDKMVRDVISKAEGVPV